MQCFFFLVEITMPNVNYPGARLLFTDKIFYKRYFPWSAKKITVNTFSCNDSTRIYYFTGAFRKNESILRRIASFWGNGVGVAKGGACFSRYLSFKFLYFYVNNNKHIRLKYLKN